MENVVQLKNVNIYLYYNKKEKIVSVEKHYDVLIENDNDPVNDSLELQNYIDKWDGDIFVENLKLDKSKSVLEIGCGTGRLLKKIVGRFKDYTGIDISSKTIERVKEHFKDKNISFIMDDFISHEFSAPSSSDLQLERILSK